MLTDLDMETPAARGNEQSPGIMQQYRQGLPLYNRMAALLHKRLKEYFREAGIIVAAVEQRVKTEESLAGKLSLKGDKYNDIQDITDIIGIRVITFYSDDVDKVASVMEKHFDIDWDNSVDKRKAHDIDSFGYLSLHYICRLPADCGSDADLAEMCGIPFEVQMRTILQHAWANMNHDTGYKSGVEVPEAYLRQLSRLAGMLELVDDEFSRIRTEINDYRRQVQSLVASGNLDDAPLDGETFRSYLRMGPFDALNRRIAAVNQAEILDVPLMNFLQVFKRFGLSTLGDLDAFVKQWSEAAFQLSRFQIGLSDIDIISSSMGPQNLCAAYILRSGGGKIGVRFLLDTLYGTSAHNDAMAQYIVEEAAELPFMNIQ